MAETKRGFAAMSMEERRRISQLGGRAAHRKGTAHRFTPLEAAEAGRKGGAASHRKRALLSAGEVPQVPQLHLSAEPAPARAVGE